MLARELLQVATLARILASGGNAMSAMREARVWENKQALYKRALDRHPCGRWEVFVGEAGRVDRMAKGRVDGDPWLALERLLLAISDAKARHLVAQ
jgi:DNA polymerase-3 subunit delta